MARERVLLQDTLNQHGQSIHKGGIGTDHRTALDLQQRQTRHGHRRNHTRYETENGGVNSTVGPYKIREITLHQIGLAFLWMAGPAALWPVLVKVHGQEDGFSFLKIATEAYHVHRKNWPLVHPHLQSILQHG